MGAIEFSIFGLGLIVILLVLALLYSQWKHMRQVQLLIDKLMSRNYVEYKQMETRVPESVMRAHDELAEDLAPLDNIAY